MTDDQATTYLQPLSNAQLFEPLLGTAYSWTPETRSAYEAGRQAGLAQGAATERERITAWLRAEADARLSLVGAYAGDDALRHAADLLQEHTP